MSGASVRGTRSSRKLPWSTPSCKTSREEVAHPVLMSGNDLPARRREHGEQSRCVLVAVAVACGCSGDQLEP